MAINLHFILGAVLLNAVMDIKMLEYPDESKNLMIGEKLVLEWKYDVNVSAQSQCKISVYVYNHTSKAKEKLAILGPESARRKHPLYKRLILDLTYKHAKILIPITTFEDSAGYGITIASRKSNIIIEKVTDVAIVGR